MTKDQLDALKSAARQIRNVLEEIEHPPSEAAETAEAREAVGEFLVDCCISERDHTGMDRPSRAEAAALYDRYLEWCVAGGHPGPLSRRRFGSELTHRGYRLESSNGAHYRLGLCIMATAADKASERRGTMISVAQRLEGLLDAARFADDGLREGQLGIVETSITRLCRTLPGLIEELYAIGQG